MQNLLVIITYIRALANKLMSLLSYLDGEHGKKLKNVKKKVRYKKMTRAFVKLYTDIIRN